MAAIETRAYITASKDHYLCPLSAVQMPAVDIQSLLMPAVDIQSLLMPVWAGTQLLTPVYREPETETATPEHIADGFSYQVTLKVGELEWQEQRLVIKSLAQAAAQQKALDKRLQKAEQEIAALNQSGQGRKRLTEVEAHAAVAAILQRHHVVGLLVVEYQVETKTTHKRGYLGRPAREETTVTVVVSVVRDIAAYEAAVRSLG